ncbi:MAG: phosphatidylglycerol lysyltransferase domain-containing protein [Candidatus Omnitrophica bacterium]|nr:phosphatidylglycerol lysyltransferase domain-containing protein [Candidatus Omnitrophota bacterium]
MTQHLSGMEFKELALSDKEIVNYYLHSERHELSVYSFQNIYLWKRLYEISWAVIEESLCVFFKDRFGSFVYLPPLNKGRNRKVLEKVFLILDELNSHSNISRIENVEQKDISLYREFGYEIRYKSCDYLCQRQDLSALAGNKFKSQRANCNHFIKNNQFEFREFFQEDIEDCLTLYEAWKEERKARIDDRVYQGMLEDSYSCLQILLEDYFRLDLEGRVIKVDNQVKAFSFGFSLNEDNFCVLYEVADLSYKGIAQFIFREFCRQLERYQYINIMDDSGLENLKTVKLSYHPVKLIPAYIATRPKISE